MATTIAFTRPAHPGPASRVEGPCECGKKQAVLYRWSVQTWLCEECMRKRGVEPAKTGINVTRYAAGLIAWEKEGRQVMMLGGETEEEAKVTIDLATGDVTLTESMEEGAKRFWEAAEALLKAQLGTGARCSCECECNRKMSVYEIFQRICAVCDAGFHRKKESETS